MIHLIEAKNFRSLKYINQEIENFHVLVGANASGKTTFLDIVNFISEIVRLGVDDSVLGKGYKSGYFRRICRKKPGGNDNFYDETKPRAGKSGGWMPSFKFGIKKTALGNLPVTVQTILKKYLQ